MYLGRSNVRSLIFNIIMMQLLENEKWANVLFCNLLYDYFLFHLSPLLSEAPSQHNQKMRSIIRFILVHFCDSQRN